MENENEIVVIKIVLVGNSGTGKSSLVSRFCDDIFPDEFVPTIGMDYRIKTL
jgi:Ras-related protein Rab-1A